MGNNINVNNDSLIKGSEGPELLWVYFGMVIIVGLLMIPAGYCVSLIYKMMLA